MMKQARIVTPNQPLEIEEVELPTPPPDGLIVKKCFTTNVMIGALNYTVQRTPPLYEVKQYKGQNTAFSGVCHSDLHQWQDKIDLGGAVLKFTEFPGYKGVAGHEILGTVYSLGENVKSSDGFQANDRVVVYPWVGCQQCQYCLGNCSNMCDKRLYIGLLIAGGFATYVMVPHKRYVLKVPDSVPMEIACMLPCSGITAYSAMTAAKSHVELVTEFEGQASLMIVGAGALGLWCLQICRASLPKTTKIVVADVTEEKLAVARQHGCDDTVLWSPDKDDMTIMQETAKKSWCKEGFIAIIDFVNTTTTFARNFECLRKNGILVMVGLFGGGAQLSLPRVVMGSKQIKGVYTGKIDHLRQLLQMLTKQQIVPPPITYFQLHQVTEALQMMDKGKMKGRGIIKFDSASSTSTSESDQSKI